ncbi:Methyltransferase domain-containing protein [Parelusimicrobium proximum]|uniref:class I SAM-dependent methyltransferase n=1 Tax=Parelusimicrobium proximum TaxID=3228953 RepID=UPI003D1809C6
MSKNMKMTDAKSLAQRIAFAPLTFQAVRAMLELGILKAVDDSEGGADVKEIMEKTAQNYYTVTTLLEVGLFTDIFEEKDGRYTATKVAQCFLYDEMTKVNTDFVHDVCYEGGYYLKESFEKGKPEGLKVFGPWKTVYEGLSKLPERVQKSWFAFDHFYSDNAFADVIKIINSRSPKRVFDVGCNTGKFELAFLSSGFKGEMVLLDLPGQLSKAEQNLKAAGHGAQCTFCPVDVLKEETKFPGNADGILMSQFLDCFSREEIISILKKGARSMHADSRLYILEPFWDDQRFSAAKLSLTHTSLYFTCIANGNSKMYSAGEMEDCVRQAGLEIAASHKNIGSHEYTLLECKLA